MSDVDSTTYGNAYTSALEIYDLWANKPDRVFFYPGNCDAKFSADRTVTTWTGERVNVPGTVSYGRKWRDNFGGERQSLSFKARGGEWYAGTLYGTYIRARRVKAQR